MLNWTAPVLAWQGSSFTLTEHPPTTLASVWHQLMQLAGSWKWIWPLQQDYTWKLCVAHNSDVSWYSLDASWCVVKTESSQDANRDVQPQKRQLSFSHADFVCCFLEKLICCFCPAAVAVSLSYPRQQNEKMWLSCFVWLSPLGKNKGAVQLLVCIRCHNSC